MKKRKAVSKLDKAIIGLICRDIPLVKEPFRKLAGALGMEEKALLGRMRYFKNNSSLRKFAAIINHKKAGFRHNAMVVWNVPEALMDKAGGIMASFGEVSHCYQREKRDGWNYNLYCMIHDRSKGGCLGTVERISGAIGPNIDYRVLFSSKEEKKAGAEYFTRIR